MPYHDTYVLLDCRVPHPSFFEGWDLSAAGWRRAFDLAVMNNSGDGSSFAHFAKGIVRTTGRTRPAFFSSHFACTAITDTQPQPCENSPRVQHRQVCPSPRRRDAAVFLAPVF